MTWELTHSSAEEQPEALDKTSSKVYNYIRKDFKRIEVTHDETTTYEWEYLECKIAKEDWDIFMEVMQNKSDIAMIEDALCELSKEL